MAYRPSPYFPRDSDTPGVTPIPKCSLPTTPCLSLGLQDTGHGLATTRLSRPFTTVMSYFRTILLGLHGAIIIPETCPTIITRPLFRHTHLASESQSHRRAPSAPCAPPAGQGRPQTLLLLRLFGPTRPEMRPTESSTAGPDLGTTLISTARTLVGTLIARMLVAMTRAGTLMAPTFRAKTPAGTAPAKSLVVTTTLTVTPTARTLTATLITRIPVAITPGGKFPVKSLVAITHTGTPAITHTATLTITHTAPPTTIHTATLATTLAATPIARILDRIPVARTVAHTSVLISA